MVAFTGYSFSPAREDLGGSKPGSSRGVNAATAVQESVRLRCLLGIWASTASAWEGPPMSWLSTPNAWEQQRQAGVMLWLSESPIQLFQVAPAGIFFWEKSSRFGIWSQQMHLSCSLVQRRERSGAASSLIPAVLSIFLTSRQPPTQNAKLDHFV